MIKLFLSFILVFTMNIPTSDPGNISITNEINEIESPCEFFTFLQDFQENKEPIAITRIIVDDLERDYIIINNSSGEHAILNFNIEIFEKHEKSFIVNELSSFKATQEQLNEILKNPRALYTVRFYKENLNVNFKCCRGSMDGVCYDCGPTRVDN